VVLSRFQFTIGQLVQVIVVSGFVFWMTRGTSVRVFLSLFPVAVLSLFPAIDFVVRARFTAAMSIGRRTLYRGLVLIAFGSAYCAYFCHFPAQDTLRYEGFTFAFYFSFIIAPVVSRLWWAGINRGYEMPPTDETCGPIAWEGFGIGQPHWQERNGRS
jgi:hypothetical protein